MNHEYDLAALRVKEIGACVHTMIFAQPTFNFASGKPVAGRLPFPRRLLQLHKNVVFYPIQPAGLHSACTGATATAWCRESFARNALLEAFDKLGGRDSDVILISDADEVPRPHALRIIRNKLLSSKPLLSRLSSIRHFKYSLHCEDPTPWSKGPIAIDAAHVRRIGSNAARLAKPPYCVARGYRSSCRSGTRAQDWTLLPNASWHLSSMSGGIDGHIFKLQSNSETITSAALLNRSHVSMRLAKCMDHLGRIIGIRKGVTGLRATAWTHHNLPISQDVPMTMLKMLKKGKFAHYLNDGVGSPKVPDPADVVALVELPSRQQCVRRGDPLTLSRTN